MSRLLAATLGRITPKYKTLSQWSETYEQIIASRQLSEKTLANRRSYLRRINAAFGGRTISAIRPHEIATFTKDLAAEQPYAAQRILIEIKDLMNEALGYGWLDRNPAAAIKPPRIKIQRRRLTLEQWKEIRRYAEEKSPPWVSRMLLLALVTGQRRSDLNKMRFSDVQDRLVDGEPVPHLHIEQQKTGTRLAIPTALRLEAIGMSIAEVIALCRDYAPLEPGGDGFLLRKTTAGQLNTASMSWRFEQAREMALPAHSGKGTPPSLHECRSLSERLYRTQGINTMILLGHSNQAMTDVYNDDRGLSAGQWKTLSL